jgi:hypothetical protein
MLLAILKCSCLACFFPFVSYKPTIMKQPLKKMWGFHRAFWLEYLAFYTAAYVLSFNKIFKSTWSVIIVHYHVKFLEISTNAALVNP